MAERPSDQPRSLNPRQQRFVVEYTACWNATEAARRAGYAHPNKQGPALLVNLGIQTAIKARLAQLAMPADEVLIRLGQHARGSMGDFIRLDEKGAPDGFNLGPDAPQHLIKKVSITDRGITFELYDAQAALALLARHHGLLVDRSEVSGPAGGPIPFKVYEVAEASPDVWTDGDNPGGE